jgi:hypothetical protein
MKAPISGWPPQVRRNWAVCWKDMMLLRVKKDDKGKESGCKFKAGQQQNQQDYAVQRG